jgi:hypothetical protein
MAKLRAPSSVQVGLNFSFLSISGTWEPNDEERKAAWELYVELNTRIAVVPLKADEGLLREALSSLYALFAITRDILRRYGPETAEPKPKGQYNFGVLAVAMLNFGIRPLLAQWHPALEDWEASKPPKRSRTEHERSWPREPDLRAAVETTRALLAQYAQLMATACGVPDLLTAVAPVTQPPEHA